MIIKCTIQLELIFKNSAGEAVFGGSSTVYSQFHIVYTYESHLTEMKTLNSLMKAAARNNRQVPITVASAPPPTLI